MHTETGRWYQALELELQMVINCHVGLRTKSVSSERAASAPGQGHHHSAPYALLLSYSILYKTGCPSSVLTKDDYNL